MPRLLTDMRDESLWAGDIIRLAHNYDLGPGSGPVDLLVYDPRDSDAGMGVMVVSGYKSGLTLSIFPKASCGKASVALKHRGCSAIGTTGSATPT